MAVECIVSANLVSIRFTGPDRALALSRGVDLHGDEITGVQLMPRDEARALLGWRVGGGYLPGYLATGWFTTPGQRGQLQLWDVYRDDEVLVIDTTRPKPSRVVLQHRDRARLAERIAAVATGA
ncbi:MAG: hypothetical protein U0Q22_14715 [Acidimicrobiales bacterium]